MEGYAYILTHPGIPTVFYDHFYDQGVSLHDKIAKLMEIRKQQDIHSRSAVKILEARSDLYSAIIDDKCVPLQEFEEPKRKFHPSPRIQEVMAGSGKSEPPFPPRPFDTSPPMAAAAHDPPSTFGNLGYFHLRFIGPSPALLVLRSDRLYSLSISRRRGHCLCLLLDRPRRRRAQGLLLNTSGCKLRLTHRSTDAGGGRVNGRPLRAGAPAELVVGDEVSLVRYGASYVFVVESFVSCRGGEGGAAAVARSREEGIVLRAESLRKRLRAISESEDPLSFFRDPYSSGNGTAVAGVKESRPDTDAELSQNHPIGPDSEVNLLRENCNLEQDKLEHHTDVVHDDVADLCHESNGCGNGSVQQNKFTNVSEEQYHNEGCYSDGSTFFLNRLVGFGPDSRAEPHSGVTLPQLFHPVESLVRVFIATFTSNISWFLDYCKIPLNLPVTIACHNKERCWSASRDSRTAAPFESHPNVLLVYPRFPEEIAFGKDRKKQGVACHHPKLIILQRSNSIRIIVTSANLVPRQWHLITNTVWWQDFPLKTSLDYSVLFRAAEKPESDFAAQLASFVASLVHEVPNQAYWINEIAKYDFEGAAGYLIASVPGLYARSPFCLEPNYFLSEKHILHRKSARRILLGSVQTSVVGISHRFHIPSDAGSKLKALSAYLGKCRVNMHGSTEVILKRNTNIPADANAVSVHIADLDNFSEEADFVHLGFLPREVAKWVSPLSDSGFFSFSGFIYPREALEAAYGVTTTKVQLLLYVSEGPEFSRISELILDDHFPPLCSLVASLDRCLGLWRLEEVLSKMKWPETLETDFIYSASSIGTSINPQFIASFASAAGKRSNQDLDSQESDPEWGCWIAKNELKKPSISVLFPTIERVKQGACGIQLSRYLLSLPEKTWQRLRSTGIFHDAIPHPDTRVGHPMHVKVARRRFESSLGGHSFGWTYCGSHNFSPAAWGQLLSPPSKVNPVGSRAAPCGQKLHICNYELGIILISPPPGMSKHASKRMPGIDDISLPFVVPPPRYTQNDRPATPLAMREVMAEACVLQSNGPVDLSEETDEDTPDEEDEHVVELSDCSQEEKEEEKIYAETLWEQVYSSQSQEKD
ncbi:hypothetical protein QOZ80_4AG0319020 [Eleusine coracana subsp. coracana]|nr:hypothetical protein QOZ80_4AG0319020 [Eleusine coracana subsp. coracana]